MSDVTDLLDQLAAGSVPVEDVAADFKTRAWPPKAKTASADPLEAAEDDPGVPEEGDFVEVAAYYSAGKITDEQYAVLAPAAAEGMKGKSLAASAARQALRERVYGPEAVAASAARQALRERVYGGKKR